MIKIFRCKYCGKLPKMMKVVDKEFKVKEFKLSHNCEISLWNNCGNWYETKRMAILDWNMNRCNGKYKILPRRDNYFLRNSDMYYPNGDLRENE